MHRILGMNPKTLATGFLSYLPGARWAYRRYGPRPGAVSALRCYGLFLKHLCVAHRHGMSDVPGSFVEFGPGSSIGAGLAALVCGAEQYYGLDAVPYLARGSSVQLFDELVELFTTRRRPPNAADFPRYADLLDARGFPSAVLPDSMLGQALGRTRIATLRRAVEQFARTGAAPGVIHYYAPWQAHESHCLASADMIMAHAVWQHVRTLPEFFSKVRAVAKPGAYITSQSSYDSHGITHEWNGHWGCSHTLWKLALGRKDFLINRMPHSAVLSMLSRHGFEVVGDLHERRPSGIPRAALNDEWQWLTDEDLETRCAFIVSRRPPTAMTPRLAEAA